MGSLRKVYHTVGGRVAKRLGLKRTPFLPTNIDIEPIDTCNFACDHCQVTHWTRKTTRLTTKRFVSILRQLAKRLGVDKLTVATWLSDWGNKPFADVWNNDQYRELRRRIAGNDIPHYCRRCYGMKPVAASTDRRPQ